MFIGFTVLKELLQVLMCSMFGVIWEGWGAAGGHQSNTARSCASPALKHSTSEKKRWGPPWWNTQSRDHARTPHISCLLGVCAAQMLTRCPKNSGLSNIFLRGEVAGIKTNLIGWVEPQWVELKNQNNFLFFTRSWLIELIDYPEIQSCSTKLFSVKTHWSICWLFDTQVLNSAKCLMVCSQLIKQYIDAFNG